MRENDAMMKEMRSSRRDGRLIKDSRDINSSASASRPSTAGGTLSNDRRRELGLGLPPVNLSFDAAASGPLDTAPQRHHHRSRSPLASRVPGTRDSRLEAVAEIEFMSQNPSAEAGALKIRLRRYEEEAQATRRLLDEERGKSRHLEALLSGLKGVADDDRLQSSHTGQALRMHQETNAVLADDLHAQLRKFRELQEEQKALILASAQECAQHDATTVAREMAEA
jgi:hypothetical protein